MARTAEVIEFGADDRTTVVARMDELAAAGRGWINLQPAVDPDDVPPEGGAFKLFSAVGPAVPLCTWTPAETGRRGTPHVSVGIQHGLGTKAVPALRTAGLTVRPGWRVVQDQSRRGLVISVPEDDDHDAVLGWLLDAGYALCRLPFDHWRAAVNRGRG